MVPLVVEGGSGVRQQPGVVSGPSILAATSFWRGPAFALTAESLVMVSLMLGGERRTKDTKGI